MSELFQESIFKEPPSAEVLLDLWLDYGSSADRDPIGLKGEPSYRYFWSTWTKYLKTGRNAELPVPIEWHAVTSEDVVGFLTSGPESRKEDTQVSDITRRRYWRLLERIYDFALQQGWVSSNPAKALERMDMPPSEDPLGAIVTPKVWAALSSILLSPVDGDPISARNRALLICLTAMALTPMEVRTLTLNSVLYAMDEGTERPHQLQLDGPGKNQRRRVVLPTEAVAALEDWLAIRPRVASKPEVESLFCTNRAASRPGGKPAGQMTSVTLLLLVRDLLVAAAKTAGQPLPARLGPQILRNTRLVMWLNEGVPASQVAVWAGLKNVKGLYHLREHLNPEIRITVKNVRDDED